MKRRSASGDIINLFISICKPILPLYKPNSSIVLLFFIGQRVAIVGLFEHLSCRESHLPVVRERLRGEVREREKGEK